MGAVKDSSAKSTRTLVRCASVQLVFPGSQQYVVSSSRSQLKSTEKMEVPSLGRN